MGKHIVAGESPVGDKDGAAAIGIAAEQLAEGGELIFLSAGLDERIQISLGKQIKE